MLKLEIFLGKFIKNFIVFILISPLFAVDNQKLIDCYKIFEQKRAELESKAEQILEQQEALETLKNTYMALINKKEKQLKLKEKELNQTKKEIELKEKKIKELVKKNEEILAQIKSAKLDKITKSFSKMRPKNAAKILENMNEKDAIEILQKLPARILSKIFAKMEPNKAALYTQLLQNDENITYN